MLINTPFSCLYIGSLFKSLGKCGINRRFSSLKYVGKTKSNFLQKHPVLLQFSNLPYRDYKKLTDTPLYFSIFVPIYLEPLNANTTTNIFLLPKGVRFCPFLSVIGERQNKTVYSQAGFQPFLLANINILTRRYKQ